MLISMKKKQGLTIYLVVEEWQNPSKLWLLHLTSGQSNQLWPITKAQLAVSLNNQSFWLSYVDDSSSATTNLSSEWFWTDCGTAQSGAISIFKYRIIFGVNNAGICYLKESN